MTAIAALLPETVATAEAFEDPPGDGVLGLFPEEAAAVARAVPKRRREFATVRTCARRALGTLGVAPVPLVPGRRGAPRWPQGVVGAMTHCDGYRAAAVARAVELASLGIDAEPDGPLPDGVLGVVSLPAERTRLARHAADLPAAAWDRLLFSAKESVFKAWYPLTARELDFTEAELDFTADGPDGGGFTARVLVPSPVPVFAGRWRRAAGLVLTAVAVSAADLPAGMAGDRNC